MECNASALEFSSTGAFSKIAMDYVSGTESLRPFYQHSPDLQGIDASIKARKAFPTNRTALVEVLDEQYAGTETTGAVQKNIRALLSGNTFTVTTAHQNNIFTGPLYFIYKILHVVKMAEELNSRNTGDHFVPVYYMGSEDADLDELNNITLHGNKLSWNTDQQGAVGRMKIDSKLLALIDRIDGQLAVSPAGTEIVNAIRSIYKEGIKVQDATFHFVNYLLGEFGVVVLIPDHKKLKQQLTAIFEDDLLHQTASGIVEKSAEALGGLYKVQAHPREINLFYLDEQVRERIEKEGEKWKVKRPGKEFTRDQLLAELNENPDHFSPNVILRGLYQETILPNIIFAGGGGELAYWLELRSLFEHYKVPMPVLFLRNSFLVVPEKTVSKIEGLGFSTADFFNAPDQLLNAVVKKETDKNLSVHEYIDATNKLYAGLNEQVIPIDPTLSKHVDALKTRALYRLVQLQKKMLRAEKRKFSDRQRQISSIKTQLFPNNNLQERTDNVLAYYARWGSSFVRAVYENSPGLKPAFIVLVLEDEGKA